jgi:Mg2+ and Co2+ transporter CorA
LELASTPGKAIDKHPDFAGLHNLAKHTIYLRENCESGLATLDGLRDHHKSVIADQANPAQAFTKQSLKYQKTLFQSTQRRLTSLDTRIANIIQLSFHIVTQGDSRLMQSENQSMKTIAVTTLVFLPLSTVAGIFGTQFMKLDDEPGHHITVSRDFWLLWLIAVPLTFIVIVVWRVWYVDAKRRLTDEIPRDAERYMGWKTLRRTIRVSKESKKGQYTVVTRQVSPDAKV